MKRSFQCSFFSVQPFRSQVSALRSRRQGFALVVILAFVVLLTVLVLAYFSYSALQRQISTASSNQATVEIFAQGAINTIVSDFKQEIFDGSTNFTYGTNTVSIPKAATNAAPFLVGTSTNLPNLIKRSAGGLPFSPAGAARASSVSSTNASQNGRSISSARWNAALLLPKATTNSTTDLTPANFTAPDWILVNRGGGNPTTWDTNMRLTSDATNTNSVVGRFAYAIYDEGGLLDVNVAGCPPGIANTVTSYKNALAFADLTQVGLDTNTVSAIVGWRNTASAQPGGSFPAYTFDATSRTNFLKTLTNSSGFLRTANTGLASGESDRQFSSRQQLIQFLNTLPDAGVESKVTRQNALQYLTTFSRALEQPSFAPDANRPIIVGSSLPPASAGAYQGNNSYYGGESAINMAGTGGFLSVRAGVTPFKRYNGNWSVPGEPLVKTRFPLSRLAWLTSEGPSSAAPSATKTALLNAGVSQGTIDSGTAANILACFGLAWNVSTRAWTYNHSITSGGNPIIGKLSDVVTANREPDFAELLKAGINAGSVGKGAYTNQGNNYSYAIDVSGDRQILQIMANLIDQAKIDNYPTAIKPFVNNATTASIFGEQDLPYFYNCHFFGLTTKVPAPLLSAADSVTISGLTAAHSRADTLTDPGSASCMIIPQVWNPHDASTPVATGGGPTSFRIVAETTDPSGTLGYWKINAVPAQANESFNGNFNISEAKPPTTAWSPDIQLDTTNGALQFTDNTNGKAFREPTLLWRNGVPNGVTLSGTSRTEDPSLTGKTYFGILIGDTKVSWSNTINGTSYIFQTSCWETRSTPGMSGGITNNFTFRMQYLKPGGNSANNSDWITYQNSFVEARLTGYSGFSLFVNAADYPQKEYANPFHAKFIDGPALTYPMASPFDPRTNRFATPFLGGWNKDDPDLNGNPTLDAVTMIKNNLTSNATLNQTVADSNFVLVATQRPSAARGQYFTWCNPGGGSPSQMGFYSSSNFNGGGNFGGLFSQNSPAVILAGGVQNYYEDPDGTCRRAMGGYVPVSGSASGRLTNTSSTIGLPMATAWTNCANGLGTITSQSQSRPIMLHRPFRSVGEMSYAFRGTPWKNIDFFTPESGDSALLDVFCVNEPPSEALVAGKVNLNTRQTPVLRALFAGAYRDEWATSPSPPSFGTIAPIGVTEAGNLADTLVGITGNTTNTWQGPLKNMADIVGHFVYPDPGPLSATDVYQYTSPSGGGQRTYAGFSAAIGAPGIWTSSVGQTTNIQRFRESAIRALAVNGQTRVWNLLIDIVAQTGRFPSSTSSLAGFVVEGEKRLWVHVAIDRLTGKVLDQQVELVTE